MRLRVSVAVVTVKVVVRVLPSQPEPRVTVCEPGAEPDGTLNVLAVP